MERKRCQVCDGPVVNGRCKLCGMPYRSDETLYHLNENRSDHYRHATSKARAIMREEEVPLGDKKPGNGGRSAKQAAAGNAGKSVKQAAAGNAGKSVKQAAAGNAGSSYKQPSAGGKAAETPAKKHTLRRLIIFLIILWVVVPGVLGSLNMNVADFFDGSFSEKMDSFLETTEMKPGDALDVGDALKDDLAPGHYMASCEDGFVSFWIESADGDIGSMTVENGEEHKVTLNAGDIIEVIYAYPEDTVLKLTLYDD